MNPRTAFALLTIGLALCLGSSVGAQVPPPPQPLKLPDLVISSLSAKLIAPNRVQYSWTVTNVGNAPANLDGPTAAKNVAVQAFLSKDTVFGNTGDVPAGGTILGSSPLGPLAPQASKSGTFTATVQANFTKLTQLVLKVDSGKVVTEFNEDNNTAAVGIAR